MKLIVGLGNPGKEYEKTRHNIGFMLLDNYLGNIDWLSKFNGMFYKKDDILFLKPTTYMNLSGKSIKECINFYNLNLEDVLVIHDDLDIDCGNHKVKFNSSSGGHNGIKSIIDNVGSQNFYRLKIGISKSDIIPIEKYVLSKFTNDELESITNNFNLYNKIITNFINYDGKYILNNQGK